MRIAKAWEDIFSKLDLDEAMEDEETSTEDYSQEVLEEGQYFGGTKAMQSCLVVTFGKTTPYILS